MAQIVTGICGSGVLVSSSPLGQSQTRTDINGENDIPKHFGCATTPDTYVCIQLRLTADPGTQSVKKGPVQYVNPDRYGEEKVRLSEDAMGWCRKGKFQQSPLSSTPNGWLNWYLPSQERSVQT